MHKGLGRRLSVVLKIVAVNKRFLDLDNLFNAKARDTNGSEQSASQSNIRSHCQHTIFLKQPQDS